MSACQEPDLEGFSEPARLMLSFDDDPTGDSFSFLYRSLHIDSARIVPFDGPRGQVASGGSGSGSCCVLLPHINELPPLKKRPSPRGRILVDREVKFGLKKAYGRQIRNLKKEFVIFRELEKLQIYPKPQFAPRLLGWTHGTDQHGLYLGLVMEWFPKGNLFEACLEECEPGSDEFSLRCFFLYQCARCLEFLHLHGIIHGDVKSANFLVKDDPEVGFPVVVLADYGDSLFEDLDECRVPQSKADDIRRFGVMAKKMFCSEESHIQGLPSDAQGLLASCISDPSDHTMNEIVLALGLVSQRYRVEGVGESPLLDTLVPVDDDADDLVSPAPSLEAMMARIDDMVDFVERPNSKVFRTLLDRPKGDPRPPIPVVVKVMIKYSGTIKAIRRSCSLRHPNIARYYELCLERMTMYVVMEHYEGGEARAWIARKAEAGEWNDPMEKIGILLQAARGILFLHGLPKPVAHRDIKPSNFLVDTSGEKPLLKLADLASSRMTSTLSQTRWQGTPGYCIYGLDGRKIDVFAFAITAWEMWTNQRAFPEEELALDPRNLTYLFMTGYRPKFDVCPEMPPELVALLESGWAAKEADRPRMSEVVARLESMLFLLKKKEEEDSNAKQIE